MLLPAARCAQVKPASCLCACYAMSGPQIAHYGISELDERQWIGHVLRAARRCPAVLAAYARAMRCPVLSYRMVLPVCRPSLQVREFSQREGTSIAHAAISLRVCYAMSGTDLASAPIGLRVLRLIRYRHRSSVLCGVRRQTGWSFAVLSGTPYATGTVLRLYYALSGTDVASPPTDYDLLVLTSAVGSYACAMRCPVLTSAMLLPGA
eukprot:1634279-Rhodomonas_salina.2